jgi:hypothetical protein
VSGESNRRSLVVRSAGAVAAGVALAGGAARSAAAHHSYPATYDTSQRVTVSGVVQLVQYTNPHIHVVIETPIETPVEETPAAAEVAAEAAPDAPAAPEAIDVAPAAADGASETAPEAQPTGEAGEAAEVPASTLWLLDLPAPSRARNIGLTPEALPVGTPLTVLAWPSRSAGSHDLAPLTITFDETGHTIRIR